MIPLKRLLVNIENINHNVFERKHVYSFRVEYEWALKTCYLYNFLVYNIHFVVILSAILQYTVGRNFTICILSRDNARSL